MISTEEKGSVVLLRMDDGKANAMAEPFFENLDRALDEASGRPIVLTGRARIFCGGLDLPVLIRRGRPELEAFLERFYATLLRLFTWPAPAVAAVNGHAIAGGCILALQADRRLMADGEFKIGVNEVQLGLVLPSIAVETFRVQLSPGNLAKVALSGELFHPFGARNVGLIEEVVPPEDLERRALVLAERLSGPSVAAYGLTKAGVRAPAIAWLRENGSAERRFWIEQWFAPATQKRLADAVAKLTAPRPPKS